MDADVWLNGNYLENHPYGYTSLGYDLTDKIKSGEKNMLSVQFKNEGQNSRWYSGSGINQHVWMQFLEPVHFAEWGTRIRTMEVSEGSAVLKSTGEAGNIVLHASAAGLPEASLNISSRPE